MDKIIKKVLVSLESSGYKAYLVGGYVRDHLLGIKSYDIDICTNALPKDLHALFPNNYNSNTYGGFNLKINKYNIDITTFRKELKYDKRKPTEILYIDNLEEDIIRRDFTINTICMDSKEKIIDLLDGVKDLRLRKIKMVGNAQEKLEEDPLRILRAIRFAAVLNFEIDEELDECIKKNYELVKTLSDIRVKEEISKILLSKNYLIGLELLKKYHILELLGISYDRIDYVNDICGMWAQLNLEKNFAWTKQELTNIINIRQIIDAGVIDNKTIYKYGLYVSSVAADILNINKKSVYKMAQKLPIKSVKELQISSQEIINLLNIEPSKKINEVKKELVYLILDKKIKNKNNDLKKAIIKLKEG